MTPIRKLALSAIFGLSVVGAADSQTPPQDEVIACRALPLAQQWGCFRALADRLKAADQPHAPVEPASPPAAAPARAIAMPPAAAPAPAPGKSADDAIVAAIIQESRNEYYATGHPCACPYDSARNGSSCGGRSAYSRPGGAEPMCYPRDVTKADIEAYRASRR